MIQFTKDIVSQLNQDDKLNFVPACISLVNSMELFAYVAKINDTQYLLRSPLYVFRPTTEDSRLLFDTYCPFSSDEFTMISDNKILTLNSLDDESVNTYHKMLKEIASLNEKKKIDAVKNSSFDTTNVINIGDKTVH